MPLKLFLTFDILGQYQTQFEAKDNRTNTKQTKQRWHKRQDKMDKAKTILLDILGQCWKQHNAKDNRVNLQEENKNDKQD